MKVVIGIPGSRSGLLLRIGQCLFAGASIGVMVTALGFSNYTAFCYLIASMALQLMWSLGLSCLDIYALWKKRDLYSPILVSLFVVGDWVTATLSFAGACSSAGVAALFSRDVHYCRLNPQLPCGTLYMSNKCTRLVGERGQELSGLCSIPLQGGGASFAGISRGPVTRG